MEFLDEIIHIFQFLSIFSLIIKIFVGGENFRFIHQLFLWKSIYNRMSQSRFSNLLFRDGSSFIYGTKWMTSDDRWWIGRWQKWTKWFLLLESSENHPIWIVFTGFNIRFGRQRRNVFINIFLLLFLRCLIIDIIIFFIRIIHRFFWV